MSKRATDPAPAPADTARSVWAEADAAQRRNLIVQAALDLLHEEGLPAVTMRAVAARLGVGTMTLYTYVDGQHGLHREMVRRGFEMLHACCQKHQPRETPEDRLCGGRLYLDFALKNPNLYKLMFDTPMDASDSDVLHGGFQPYMDRVQQLLAERGDVPAEDLPREARRRAGRLWIAMHGLAMIALAGRLDVLEGDLDELLADLLPRVGIHADDPPKSTEEWKK